MNYLSALNILFLHDVSYKIRLFNILLYILESLIGFKNNICAKNNHIFNGKLYDLSELSWVLFLIVSRYSRIVCLKKLV